MMKKLFFALMISLTLVACKEDDPEPQPEIATIADTWKQTAYEKTVDGKKVWIPVDGEPTYISFRFDGVVLDGKGLPLCCPPDAYYVNGVLFEVKPKAEVPVNNVCMTVDCIGCATWDIEQTGDEMILTYCKPVNMKLKFIRQ
ncbi:hypothetical protein [Dyadobacter sp. CY351]|uniref:hypothetical protein n=1 Tax=Dyadobacter sp. CY351 TaxID=2909337 RepID=UPI001F24DF31|nr:hypothetical protein [Dyadobacter sp. CY351]MCF2517680.1 hypothetical protein [Dyadobacter sp. CY351]